ncbi:DnaJ domain-containing protein [Saccharopolyspora sp. NPDC047091]|uniref:scabin-related ADP-ribosyltransferase n=1 Tax=Saccharopolyspora sp. NPDC047091 TaxID=3155924 RepID=UPI0033FAFF96
MKADLSSTKDHYAVLGAARGEDIADIRKKWRKLLIANHPDKNLDNKEMAQANTVRINAAWKVLSDPEQRQQYDDRLRMEEEYARYARAAYGDAAGPSSERPERRHTGPTAESEPDSRRERPHRSHTEPQEFSGGRTGRPSSGPRVSPEEMGLARGRSLFTSEGRTFWDTVMFRLDSVWQRPIYSQAQFDPRGQVKIGVSFVWTPSRMADFYTSIGMPQMDQVMRTAEAEDLGEALRHRRHADLVWPSWGEQGKRYPIVSDVLTADGARFQLPPGAVYLQGKALDKPMEVRADGAALALVNLHSTHFQEAYALNRRGSLFAMACGLTQNQHSFRFMREFRRAGYANPAHFPRDVLGLYITPNEEHLVLGVSGNAGIRSYPGGSLSTRRIPTSVSDRYLYSPDELDQIRLESRMTSPEDLPPRPPTEHRGPDEQPGRVDSRAAERESTGPDERIRSRAQAALLNFDPPGASRGGRSTTPAGTGGHRPETPLGMGGAEAHELTTYPTLRPVESEAAGADSPRSGGAHGVTGRGAGRGGLETIPEEPADATEPAIAEQERTEEVSSEQDSVVDRALRERPEVDGEIDGTRIRAKIKDLVRDPKPGNTELDERVDIAFSDQNLKDGFRAGLEGLHIVDLGDKPGRGPRVVLDVTELSEPEDQLPGTGDVRTSGGRERVLHQVSSSRAKARAESAGVRVPTPFVAVSGKLAGAAHQRESSMSSAAKRGTSTELTEPHLPVAATRHQARYRISVTSAGRRPQRYSSDAVADLRLKWPLRSELNPEGGLRMGSPEAIEHVDFSGAGGIYRAVRDKLGGDFSPNDAAELDFRTMLAELGAEGRSLLSGEVLRKTFDFANAGKPVDVLIGVADLRPLRATTAQAKLTRTELTGGEISSGEAITFRHGGGGGIAGGDVTGVTGLLFGPQGEDVRNKIHNGSAVAGHEHVTTENYEGPLDELLANLTYVVDVLPRNARATSGEPALVEGTVTSRLKPHNAEQHGWTNSVAAAPVELPAREADAGQARNAPDRVDAVHRLPKATVDALVGPALSELAVRGHVAARELPRTAQRMRRFVQDHAREITRGDGVRFPLSALYEDAPDVFFHGNMDLDRAELAADEPGKTIGGKLVSTYQRVTGQTKDRTRAGGIGGMGYADIFWPGLTGLTLDHTNTAGDTIARKVAHEQSFTGKGQVRRYAYPAEFTTRLGGTWSNPGTALPGVTGEVHVAAADSPGTALGEPGGETEPDQAWQDGPAGHRGRDGDLPAGFELDSLAPVPGLRRTTANMLGGIPFHRWREALKRPFIGRAPAKFDEHHGHWLRSNAGRSNDPGEGVLNERNAGLGGLEVFSSPEERMAGFAGAVLLGDRRELKTHNRGGVAGSRELHADISLRTRLSNPTPIRIDEHHWFTDKSNSETDRAVNLEKSLMGKLRAGAFAVLPVNKESGMGAGLGGELAYTRGSGTAESRNAKSTEAAGHYERGYLIRYDGEHTAHTSVRRRWESLLRRLHDGTPVHATKSLRQAGYATVWVPAGEIDQVGRLAEADIANLRPEDAERYRWAHGPDAAVDETPAVAPSGGEARSQQDEPRDVEPAPAVRPPDDVGRGKGVIAAHRLKAGGELAEGITEQLARRSRANGQSTSMRSQTLSAVLRALRGARASIDPPAAQRLFDSLNERMMRDSVWPVLGSRKGDPVLREIVNGGWPLLVVTDQPFGRVEQLVVVRGTPRGGRFHQTIGQPADPGRPERSSEHEFIRQSRQYDTHGFFGRLTALFVGYPQATGAPAGLIAPGGSLTYNTVSQPEHVLEHTTGALADLEGASHQFVHDLDLEIDVHPYASPGAYRKLLPDWVSTLSSPVLSEPWSGSFTVPDAIRSTVPVQETIPLGSPEPEPLAEQALSLRHDQQQRGLPLGFSANAVVHVGRFAAPRLREAVKNLFLGGDGRHRPRLRPGDAYSLLTEVHVDKLRNNLPSAMSASGYQAELTSGPLAGVVIKAGLTQRKLHQVLDGSLKPSEAEERLVKWAADQGLDWGPAFMLQFRDPQIQNSTYRPVHQLAELEKPAGQWNRKQSTELSAKLKTDAAEHRTMYLVTAVARWRVEPSYRGNGNPAEWEHPISTGRDEPIPLLVDRQGLLDLGFELPAPGEENRAEDTGPAREEILPLPDGTSDQVTGEEPPPESTADLPARPSELPAAADGAHGGSPRRDREIDVRLDEGRALPLGMDDRDLDDVDDSAHEHRWMVPDGAEVVRLAQARDPESPHYRPGWDQLTPVQSWALLAAELRGARFHQRDRNRAIARIRRLNERSGANYPDSKAERAEIAAAAHEKLKAWPIARNLFPLGLVPDGKGGQAPMMRLLAEGQPIRNAWERGVLRDADASHRAKVEWWFGYSSALQQGDDTSVADPSEMPRYAAVIPPSRTEGTAVQWGTVVLHWNDEVRARTTFTPGDTGLALSDDSDANAVKYTDNEHLYTLLAYGDEELFRHLVAEATDFRYDPELAGAPGPSTHDYLEAQIHGPLDLSAADKVVINWGRISAHDGFQPSSTRAEAEQLVADLRSTRPELTVELGKELGAPGEADAAEQDRVRRLYGLAPDRILDEHELAAARELDRLAGGGPFARHAERQDLIRLLIGEDASRPDDEAATRMLSELFDDTVRRGVRGSSLDAAPGADAQASPMGPEWRSARVHAVSADGMAPLFEVRRFTSGDEEVVAATVRLSLRPGAGVSAEQVARSYRSLQEAAERRVNAAGQEFSSGAFAGARFVLDVRRDDRPGGAAHAGFTVVDGPASDGRWSVDGSGDELLDGVLQQLGAPPVQDGADVLGPERLAGIASSVAGSWPIHPDPRLREEHPAHSAGFDVAEYDNAREHAAVTTVDADLTLPLPMEDRGGPRAYFDVRRFEVGGLPVVEGTLRLDLAPAEGVTAEEVDAVWRSTVFGMNYLVNSQGLLFPAGGELTGERLLVRVERSDADSAHRRMDITGPGSRADDGRLPVGKSPLIYGHELLHRFGFPDEHKSERRLPADLLQHIRNHKQLVARHMADWGGVTRHAHNTGTNVMGGIDAQDLTVAPHVPSRQLSRLDRVISGALASPTPYRGPDHEPTGQHAPEPSPDDDPVTRFKQRRLQQLLTEVNDYLAIREPDSTHVWRGADGRDRRGGEPEWQQLIDRGEKLFTQWNAEHAAGRPRREPYVLENRVETLKRELELGRNGTRPTRKISYGPEQVGRPTTRSLKRLIADVEDHAERAKSRLDLMGDTLGDIGAGTEHRGVHRRIQRGFRRLFTELHDWRAEAVSGQPIDRERFESLAQLYHGLLNLEHAYESEFEQVTSPLEKLLAKMADVMETDLDFAGLLTEYDSPKRRVSAIRPSNAFDAALRPVDPSELRLLDMSAAPGGILWRTDDEPLYREDDRDYEAVFRSGLVPWDASALPPSLNAHQTTFDLRTSFVSLSRDKDFAAAWGDSRWSDEYKVNHRESDRVQVFEIDAPGGIDLVASMNRYAIPKQQEVDFPGGIRPEYIRGVELRYDDGRIEYVPNPAYRARSASTHPSSSAPVMSREQAPGSALGRPGVSYPGPSRPGLLSGPEPGGDRPLPPVVHRGEFEVEDVDGEPHVRLYTVVSAPQLPQRDVLSDEPTAASLGDVQQDPVSGRIQVLSSQVGRPLSVIAGRPLSAVQLLAAAEDVLAEMQPWRSANPPVIRSYLAPLKFVRELSREAEAREEFPHQHDGRTVNVWPKAGPNLFTVAPESLPDFAGALVPGSMVTYTSGLGQEGLLRGDWAGSVEHVDGLRDRLGVPRTDRELNPNWRAWPTLDELEAGSLWQSRRIARGLRQHYSTWLELVSPSQRKAASELRAGDPELPLDRRAEELRDFLDEHGFGETRLDDCAEHHGTESKRPCELDDFMQRTVRPWADQAAIVVALAEDHGRMLGDLGITGKGADNEFAAQREELPQERARQRAAGAAITAQWRDQVSPDRLVATVGEHLPEFLHRDGPHFGGEDPNAHRERVRHALARYQELARDESDSERVIPVDAVVKAILFRGLASDSAQRQQAARYEQYADEFPPLENFADGTPPDHDDEQELVQNEAAEQQRRLDVVPGNAVAAELAGSYGDVFAEGALEAARMLVASDPFGRFHAGKAGADAVFAFVARTALRLTGRDPAGFEGGLPDDAVRDVRRLFVELHQLHQAERDAGDFATGRRGEPVTTSRGRLFAYGPDSRRERADLESLFATPRSVREAYARLFPAQPQNRAEESAGRSAPGPAARESEPEPVPAHRERPLLDGDSDSDDSDSDSEPGSRDRAPEVGDPEFRARYPEFLGVNAARYAGGAPGHRTNCHQAVLAAWATRVQGELVTASPAAPIPVREFAAKVGAWPVAATEKRVAEHVAAQRPGALGVVLLNGPAGKLHAVLGERGADGRALFADVQRGVMVEPAPDDVAGYVPLPGTGAKSMAGAPLHSSRLIGMLKYPVGEGSGSRPGQDGGARDGESSSRGGSGSRLSGFRAAFARVRGSAGASSQASSRPAPASAGPLAPALGRSTYGQARLARLLHRLSDEVGLVDGAYLARGELGVLPSYADSAPDSAPESESSVRLPDAEVSWRPVAADSVVAADHFASEAANAAFVARHFPEFLGVNALPYARRVSGHRRNGAWSVLAGALTADFGTSVPAPSGDLLSVEEFDLLHGQLLLPNLIQAAEAVIFEGDPARRETLRNSPLSRERVRVALEHAETAEDALLDRGESSQDSTQADGSMAAELERIREARQHLTFATRIIRGVPPHSVRATYDQVLHSMREDPESVPRAVYLRGSSGTLHPVLLMKKPSEDGGNAFYFLDPHTGLMASARPDNVVGHLGLLRPHSELYSGMRLAPYHQVGAPSGAGRRALVDVLEAPGAARDGGGVRALGRDVLARLRGRSVPSLPAQVAPPEYSSSPGDPPTFDVAAAANTASFARRFPLYAGVNAARYARGEAGYTENCVPSVLAAWESRATGATVTAGPSHAWSVGALQERLGVPPVAASHAQVVEHVESQAEAASGAMLVRSPMPGMLHVVLAERDATGAAVFPDPQRGSTAEPNPDDVVGYVPFPRSGAKPLPGPALDPNLLIGMQRNSGAGGGARVGEGGSRPGRQERFRRLLRRSGLGEPTSAGAPGSVGGSFSWSGSRRSLATLLDSAVRGSSGNGNPAGSAPSMSPVHAALGLPPHYSELPDNGEPVRPDGRALSRPGKLVNSVLTAASFANRDADRFISLNYPQLLGINPGGRRKNSCGPSLIATMLTLVGGVTVHMDAEGPMTVGCLQRQVLESLVQRSLAEYEAAIYEGNPREQRSARNRSAGERINALRAHVQDRAESGYDLTDERLRELEEMPSSESQRVLTALYRDTKIAQDRIGDLQRLNDHPPETVSASFDEVVPYIRRFRGITPVFLRGSKGMLHVVAGMMSTDGVVMFVDGDRATVPDVNPENVVGMLPINGDFTGPQQHPRLDPELLVGAPAGQAVLSAHDFTPVDPATAAPQEIRAAAQGGDPVSAGHLAERFGMSRQRALEQIGSVAHVDALAAVRAGRPLSPAVLAEKYGRNGEWARDVVFRVAAAEFGAELRAASAESPLRDAGSLHERFGATERQNTALLEAAVVAELRAAADLGRPYDPDDLAARFAGHSLPANTLIAIAGALDARAAARDDGPHTPAALASKYGFSSTRAHELIGFAALADAREAIDGGGSHTVAELAARYGMSRRWAFERIEDARDTSGLVQPWPFTRVSRPLADGLGTVSAAARRARAEVRAAVAAGRPRPAEELAERFGKPRAWAFDQIDQVAHVDVMEASGRGEQYDTEALAAKYGMDDRWAGRRISDAFAWEQTKKNAAVALVLRYVDSGRPFGPEAVDQVTAKFDLRPETASDRVDDAAQDHVIAATRSTVPYTAARLAERYARSEDWAAEQITAALIRETLSRSRPVHHKFGLSRAEQMSAVRAATRTFALRTPFGDLHRRRLINADHRDGGVDYERELDTDDSGSDSDDLVHEIRATDLGRRFGLAVESVEQQINSAARLLARAAADEHLPYSASELGERFGKDSRWAFNQIGAAMRADAGGDRVETAALAERYGVSVAVAEHHLVEGALADVRAAGDRIVNTNETVQVATWEQQLRDLAFPRTLDELTGPLGLSREEGLFWIGVAQLLDEGATFSVDVAARQYGIDEAEAEHLARTRAAFAAMYPIRGGRDWTWIQGELSDETGQTEEWVNERMEEAVLHVLRGAGTRTDDRRTYTAASLRDLANVMSVGRDWLRDRLNRAAEADLVPNLAGPSPYTGEKLAQRYGMVVRWGEDRISRAARDDARAAVRDGRVPYTVEALARRRGIGRDVAERAIAAAVFDDAHAAGRSNAVAAFAQHYGLGEEALDRHRAALARLDVREAADRVRPIGDAALAEKYGRSRSWAAEQVDAAAGEFLADVAVAFRTPRNDVAEMFGRDHAWESHVRRVAARADVRAALDRGTWRTAFELRSRYFLSAADADQDLQAVVFDDALEAMRGGARYTVDDVRRKYGLPAYETIVLIDRLVRDQMDRGGFNYRTAAAQFGLGEQQVRTAALEHARNARNEFETLTPGELAEQYGLSPREAESLLDYADNVPDDSDFDSQ